MGVTLDHIHGKTFHGRHGAIENSFTYGIDYILTDFGQSGKPLLFSRNRFNLTSLFDRDHGGERGKGVGLDWVREVLMDQGLMRFGGGRIELLAQPRVWGHVFNPVCFWLIYDAKEDLRLVIAEVNNTFGHRHSYLCHTDDFAPISKEVKLHARKVFHVSPFQDVSGNYSFRFDITKQAVGIWIDYQNGNKGVLATFTGKRQKLTNLSILKAAIRRPFGSIRVLALINFQAIKLYFKGALFRPPPKPPTDQVSR